MKTHWQTPVIGKWLIAMTMAVVSVQAFAVVETRRSRVNVDVTERKRAKTSGQAGKNKLNRSAIFTIEVEEKLIKNINATISYLQKQADRMPKRTDGRLNLLDKVFNLEIENAVYLRNKEEREYDERWTVWDENGRRGTEPRLNSNASGGAWRRVISRADLIIKEFPRNKKADSVIFHQAVAMQYIGREKEAAKIYTQLIQNYPNSPVAGDAYAALGDYYFDRDDFRNAMNNFKQALRYRRSKRYLWSMFKLGWCSYNLSNYKEALRYWQQVVAVAKSDSQKENVRLKDEALRDMVYAFAELKDVETAIRYYRANGGSQYIGTFLRLLAQTFSDQGQYALAIKTLRRFQATVPNSPDGPAAEKEIINLAYELGHMKVVWDELEKFEGRYGTKSAWAAANAEDKKLILETQQMIKDQMLYYAKFTHQRAQKNSSVPLHNEAKKGYLIYLRSYPTGKEVVEIKYNLADIEYFLKNYTQEGKFLLEIALLDREKAVVYDAKSGKSSNIHRDAALGMVRAFARDFEPDFKKMVQRKPDFSKPPIPLSAKAQNYIRGCSLYSKWYPKDEKVVKTCDLDTTKIHYQSNNRKQAMRYLWFVANKYPNSKEGPDSVEQLIPLYRDDRAALLSVADKLLQIPAYRKGELGKKLMALKRGAEVEDIAKEKDMLKRAQRFEAQAKKNPNDPESDKLIYNAAGDYVKAGAVGAAISAYLYLIKRYPKAAQVEDSLLQVAKLYEKQLDFATAATYYQAFAQKYPKAKETAGATAKVCDLNLAIGSDKAMATCLAFAQRFPDGGQPVIYRLIVGLERAKRYSQMAEVIRRNYLNKYKLSANDIIIEHYRIYRASKGTGAAAAQASRDIVAIFERNKASVSGEALRYVGEQVFRSAQAEIPRYLNVKLAGGTVDRLAASIDAKAVALQRVKTAFDRVTATKDSYWGVAALHQLGYVHEAFAKTLEKPPAIQGAKQEDVLKQLTPQIQQLNQEALNWYKLGMDTVTQFKAYNEWGPRLIDAVARVSGSGATFEDWVVDADFVGTEVSPQLMSVIHSED